MHAAPQTAERSASATISASAPSRWTRIIPLPLIMYTIAFIDRTNISLALPRISHDLHLDPQQAGTVAGIFFWGYLVLQIPGGHLAKHWSPKKFISVLLVAWSLFAVGCGVARTYRELLVLRLLLGGAETVVFPPPGSRQPNAVVPTHCGCSVPRAPSFSLRLFPAGCWTTGAGASCSSPKALCRFSGWPSGSLSSRIIPPKRVGFLRPNASPSSPPCAPNPAIWNVPKTYLTCAHSCSRRFSSLPPFIFVLSAARWACSFGCPAP